MLPASQPREDAMTTTTRLFGFWRSTATWRVRIALNLKGVPYEYVPVRLGRAEHRTPEFLAKNPMAHVPVLEIDLGGTRRFLAESIAIIELLDEVHPLPALLPKDPFLRTRARQLALLVASGIQPLQNTKVQSWVRDELHADDVAWVRHWVDGGLRALETLTRETTGRFSIGDAPSVADVCLVPQLAFARRFGLSLDAYPTLVRIDEACAPLEAFRAAHAHAQVDAEK
jgi:maleylacetoacetate isomerase